MIQDVDLDIKNYQKKRNWDTTEEILVYLRADLKDGDYTYAACGDVLEIIGYFGEIEDFQDIVLSAAAYIIKRDKIDFQEILNDMGDD